MHTRIFVSTVFAGMTLFGASPSWADFPSPSLNKYIGTKDVPFRALMEADCRACHSSGVPDRHHSLYDRPIPPGSLVPYLDTGGDGVPSKTYSCVSCHGTTFIVERDCTECHNNGSPHHESAFADTGDCVACDGDLVDNKSDSHDIPTYTPSLVTVIAGAATAFQPLSHPIPVRTPINTMFCTGM